MDFLKVKDFIKAQNLPAYRLNQIRQGVFVDGKSSWAEIKTLPKNLQELLTENFKILSFDLVKLQRSKLDKVYKALLKLHDGHKIETVLMRPGKFWSVCVSSQAGCPLGCAFCATGKLGFKRNLTAEEISDQVLFWHQFLQKEFKGERVSNIVFMGMGEPLLNYQEVKKAVEILSNKDYLNIGKRHISISTSGIADKFENLAKELPQVNLALSLHNADNKQRSALMPINRKYNLDILKQELENYLKLNAREVFLEYTVIDGVNNLPAHIRKLGKWINSFKDNYLLHVNLIACNEATSKAITPPIAAVYAFAEALEKMNIKATVRKSLGSDIAAACGQLAAKN